MHGAIPPLLQYVFMAWYLVKRTAFTLRSGHCYILLCFQKWKAKNQSVTFCTHKQETDNWGSVSGVTKSKERTADPCVTLFLTNLFSKVTAASDTSKDGVPVTKSRHSCCPIPKIYSQLPIRNCVRQCFMICNIYTQSHQSICVPVPCVTSVVPFSASFT
jgi:hypothetical protein